MSDGMKEMLAAEVFDKTTPAINTDRSSFKTWKTLATHQEANGRQFKSIETCRHDKGIDGSSRGGRWFGKDRCCCCLPTELNK